MTSTARRFGLLALALVLLLTSCDFGWDYAIFRTLGERMVVVEIKVPKKNLDKLEVGQQVWLIRDRLPPGTLTNWEILTCSDREQIGFEPTRDTTFVFRSKDGAYRRQITLGTLTWKP